MSPERWLAICTVFDGARTTPAELRGAFLGQACGEDLELRAEVESLLREHERSSRIFSGSPSASTAASERIPERIGPYRVLSLLARGGMGEVYLAEQESPRRPVALKLLPAGLARPDRLLRFRRESEILGRLQHPGIARIYEAGTSDRGGEAQAFFSMELVLGRTLTEHARERGLGTKERVQLLAQVAKAVQYAHEQGVVHRDLKPDNVLVEESGLAKVLDFGIARPLDPELGGATAELASDRIAGTLPYMSPEQLEGDVERVDARSDVYALGVLAYELLAGRPPHELAGRSVADARAIVCAREAPRLRELDARIPRDLEAIVSRAIERDRDRRYASAEELAADLDRFLHGEPVRARKLTALYQLHKFTLRNRVLVAGVLATVAALAAGLVASLVEGRRARRNAELAAERTSHFQETYRFLEGMLLAVDPDELGREARLVDYLGPAATELDERNDLLPVVEARLRYSIGYAYDRLGRFGEARRQLERSVELFDGLSAREPVDAARAGLALGNVYFNLGLYEQAEARGRAGTGALELLEGAEDFRTSEEACFLPTILQARGNSQESVARFEDVLATRRRVLGEGDARTVDAMVRLAAALMGADQRDEALALLLAARAAAGSSAEIPIALRGAMLHNLAVALHAEGRTDEARESLAASVALHREHFGDRHASTLSVREQEANFLLLTGRPEEALELLEATLADRSAVEGESHVERLGTLCLLAQALGALELRDQQLLVLDELGSLLAECPARDERPGIELRIAVSKLRRALGQEREARALAAEALEVAERRFPEDHALCRLARGVVASYKQ